MITIEKLEKICGVSPRVESYLDPLNKTFEKYDISNNKRIAAFLSQVIVESGTFTHTVENLNYSAGGLLNTFSKYFTPADAAKYARQPEKIGNRAYANRGGNGNEASGDGYKYRGRGLIQLTFKSNYEAAAKSLGMTIDELVAYMTTPEGATMSAGWFWDKNKLNAIADMGSIETVSKKVNGGTNGLEDRIKYYKLSLAVLG